MAPPSNKISDERFLLILLHSHKGSAKTEWEKIAEQCGMRNGKAVENRLYGLKKRIEASEGPIGAVNGPGTPNSSKKGNGSKVTAVTPKKRAASGDSDDEELTPLKEKSASVKKAKLEACEKAVMKAEEGSDDEWA